MTQDAEPRFDLPNLAAVFEALRRGRQICMTDGPLYTPLKSHTEDFTALFAQLGFELVHHPRDFFYFVDRSNFTDLSARMAVFVFILIEHLADRGDAIEETVMSRHFRPGDLPHLTVERYRRLMGDAAINEPGEVEQLVQTMERFGFVNRLPDESFTFRPAAYRFLDLALDMPAADRTASEPTDAESTDPDQQAVNND